MIGYDGAAFFLHRGHFDDVTSRFLEEIDRDLPGGQSTTLWTDGNIEMTAGDLFGPMAIISPGGEGGYVSGFVQRIVDGGTGQPTVMKLDATGDHVGACTTDPNTTFGSVAVSTGRAYAVVLHDEDAGSTWGIARMAP